MPILASMMHCIFLLCIYSIPAFILRYGFKKRFSSEKALLLVLLVFLFWMHPISFIPGISRPLSRVMIPLASIFCVTILAPDFWEQRKQRK